MNKYNIFFETKRIGIIRASILEVCERTRDRLLKDIDGNIVAVVPSEYLVVLDEGGEAGKS